MKGGLLEIGTGSVLRSLLGRFVFDSGRDGPGPFQSTVIAVRPPVN